MDRKIINLLLCFTITIFYNCKTEKNIHSNCGKETYYHYFTGECVIYHAHPNCILTSTYLDSIPIIHTNGKKWYATIEEKDLWQDTVSGLTFIKNSLGTISPDYKDSLLTSNPPQIITSFHLDSLFKDTTILKK